MPMGYFAEANPLRPRHLAGSPEGYNLVTDSECAKAVKALVSRSTRQRGSE